MPEYPHENDLKSIQGLVVRAYPLGRVAHFILEVKNAAAGRAFVHSLVKGGKITTGQNRPEGERRNQPALNIGFTFNGFKALGLAEACNLLAAKTEEGSEFEPFVKGAAERAIRLGDIGDSAPDRWFPELRSDRAHVLLSLYHPKSLVDPDPAYNDAKKALEDKAQEFGLLRLSLQEGKTLEDGTFHFGFKDGFAQPNIKGFPLHKHSKDGDQTITEAGAFVLGYPSQFPGHSFDYDFPKTLGYKGTFAAFRALLQDVDGFETHLQRIAAETGCTVDEAAARVCGRKRDGTPLITGPDINDFNYKDDPNGAVCPFTAHIRRANPRDDRIAGGAGSVSQRRLIRRGMPFGPRYDPAKPNDGVPRGLLGLFLCASLRDQFEFVVRNWLNRGGFHAKLPAGSVDPFTSLGDFVSTRGALYCFMPSVEGLEYIGAY
jgi:hypothetical protein